jgi:spermidine synthase
VSTPTTSPERAPGLALAALLLIVSGAAALVHQVAWVRLFGTSVGTSHEAVATVLAAFFFGMGLGSLLAERWTRSPRAAAAGLAAYSVLELAIGVGGLALFWILPRGNAIVAQVPVVADVALLRFLAAFLLLAAPAACMGATLPVLAATLVRRRAELASRLGALYALNTLGAAAGALLAGFVLIPRFGLSGAVHAAVFANLAVAAVAWFARGRGTSTAPVPRLDGEPERPPAALRAQALLVLAVTGFVALACEVAWTRGLALLTGSTIYGFATILTAFLLGIAIGAWCARRLAGRIAEGGDPRTALAVGLVLLGAALLVTRAGFAALPAIQAGARDLDPGTLELARFGAAFLLLLPPTFLFGALYPLSLKLYCGDVAGVRGRLGRAFAVNTFAGIAGSLAAGFWWVPTLGTDGILLVGAVVTLCAPIVLVGPPLRLRTARLAAAPGLALALVAPLLPGLDAERLVAAVRYRRDAPREAEPRTLYLAEGRTGIVSIITHDGLVAEVQNNGLQEALIDMAQPRYGPATEGLLGALPYLLHPDPKSAFVVGFGGGSTVQTLAFTGIERIRVVELEPRIVDAVATLHAGAIPCLADPRVELSFGDARSRLVLEDERYDLIASQPSHPWVAGAGGLFTVEMFELARSRLTEQGIMAQWVNLFRMDPDVLRTVVGTFYSVFPEGFVCVNAPAGDLILIGSPAPLRLSSERVRVELSEHAELDRFFELHELATAGDLLWYFYGSRDAALALAGSAPRNTDMNLLTEVRLAALGREQDPEGPWPLLLQNARFDVQPYLDPEDALRTLQDAGRFFHRFEAIPKAHAVVEILRAMGAHERASQLAADLEPSVNAVPSTGR